MDNKYYTPESEEFHDFFEFEYNHYDEAKDEFTGVWIKSHFDVRCGLGHDLYHMLNDGQIRVPYLTKEDIEAEGFRSTIEWEDKTDFEKGDVWSDDKNGGIFLSWYEKDNRIKITSTDGGSNQDGPNHSVKFNGIIKNKSVLRKILKMIHA